MRHLPKALLALLVVLLSGGVASATWSARSSGTSTAGVDALSTPVVGTATNVTSTSATVTWTAQTGWQGSATYTATLSSSGHTTVTCNAAASTGSCAATGLDAGVTYTISVVGTLNSWSSAAGTGSLTTVSPTPNFLLTPAAGTYTAGTAFNVVVQARLGTVNDTSYTGAKTLSVADTNTAPDTVSSAALGSTSVTFNASGQGTAAVTLYKAMAGNSFSISDGTRTGSAAVTVAAGSASKLAWTNPSVSAGTLPTPCLFTCTVSSAAGSSTFTAAVSVTDGYGNVAKNLGTGHTVTVTTPSNGAGSGGSFSSSGTSVTLTIASTGDATSTATFTFNAEPSPKGNWSDTFSTQTSAGTIYASATGALGK